MKSVSLPDEIVDRLDHAARERVVGRNRLAELLLSDALDHLIPVEELALRRSDDS